MDFWDNRWEDAHSYLLDRREADVILEYYGDQMVPLKSIKVYYVVFKLPGYEGRYDRYHWVSTNENFTGEDRNDWTQWSLPLGSQNPTAHIEVNGWHGWTGDLWFHRGTECGDAPWDRWAQKVGYVHHGNGSQDRRTSNESQANLITDYYNSRGITVTDARAYPFSPTSELESQPPCPFLASVHAPDTFVGYLDGWMPSDEPVHPAVFLIA